MSAGTIALLGAIAGFTIFLGLPIGRVRASMPRTKALLNAIAIGAGRPRAADQPDHRDRDLSGDQDADGAERDEQRAARRAVPRGRDERPCRHHERSHDDGDVQAVDHRASVGSFRRSRTCGRGLISKPRP